MPSPSSSPIGEKMHNIDKDYCKDLWIMSLTNQQRAAWLAMILSLVDDQGRFFINRLEVRLTMFYSDSVTDEEMMDVLHVFETAGKVVLYSEKNNQYCQIVNWWKYQTGAKYMAKSKYPAPEGWIDRYCFTGKGRKPVRSPYWEFDYVVGFFPKDQLPILVDQTIFSQ